MLLPRLLHPMRSVHRWHEATTRMSAIARLADRMWGTSAGERRARAATQPPPPKRVVVMGDGCFGGGFPKKTFARELGMRGPTLIMDEFEPLHWTQAVVLGVTPSPPGLGRPVVVRSSPSPTADWRLTAAAGLQWR